MSNFIDISRNSQRYTEPVPFQQFRGNYATMVHTAATGMFGTVTLPVGTTPGVCRQLCESNINCEMWTFDSSRMCNLYNSTDASTITGIRVNRSLRSSPVSPFSIHSNTIPRRNLVVAASPAPSLQACEQRCNVTSACALYTYSLTGTGTCSMYQFGPPGSGNVGSSRDLLITAPEFKFIGTPYFTANGSNVYNFTYNSLFTSSVTYSVIDKNNPTQIVYGGPVAPIPGTSGKNTPITFSVAPTLGNAYVSTVSITSLSVTPSPPVYFYANTATSTSNVTVDYTDSTNSKKYRCHIFTAGTNVALTINGQGTIEYFVVGGGGGGAYGNLNSGGGGGGGGQVMQGSLKLSSVVTSLTVTVGTGGNGGTSTSVNGFNGNQSNILNSGKTIAQALGGTGGIAATSSTALGKGGNSNVFNDTTRTKFNGGSTSTGSGGGGAGTSTPSTTANGGSGVYSNFKDGTNTSTGYGGGGGGGGSGSLGKGGAGIGTDGGGRGVLNTETAVPKDSNGTPNTGGGGGGGKGGTGNTPGAPGGSGIVMIRYELK